MKEFLNSKGVVMPTPTAMLAVRSSCSHENSENTCCHTTTCCGDACQNGSHSGFSLMELIVTVLIIGIILVIAIPFFFGAQDSARQAVVDTTARDGEVMARANIIQGDPYGGDLGVLETEDVVLSLAGTFVPGDESTVCVRADWIGTGEATNYAVSGPCAESDTTVPIIDREEDDPLYTTMTYKCPSTRSGYLGIINISDDARVQIWENNDRDDTIREIFYQEPAEDFDLRYEAREEIVRSRIAEDEGIDAANAAIEDIADRAADEGIERPDASEYAISNTIKNTSELIEMRAGVTYSVRFDGEVETFSAPGHRGFGQGNVQDSLADCLVSIDHFGDDIGLKNIVYLGGRNLESVPDNLPSTVGSLRAAFENATSFNDASVSSWDVSNVYSMQSMFYNTSSFNQPLNDWDTSGLKIMAMMFRQASDFNQPLDNWDVSNVDNISSVFYDATSFNSSVNGWNISNATNIASMFRNSGFNQPLDEWEPESAANMAFLFHESPFNQDISHWETPSVERHGAFATVLDEDYYPDFQ